MELGRQLVQQLSLPKLAMLYLLLVQLAIAHCLQVKITAKLPILNKSHQVIMSTQVKLVESQLAQSRLWVSKLRVLIIKQVIDLSEAQCMFTVK